MVKFKLYFFRSLERQAQVTRNEDPAAKTASPFRLFFFFSRIFLFSRREQEAPYADGCSQIEILQTLKEHGGSGLLPSGSEDRAPLSEAFVGFVADCLRVKPEVS